MWDLWCTKWHWDRFSPSTSVSRLHETKKKKTKKTNIHLPFLRILDPLFIVTYIEFDTYNLKRCDNSSQSGYCRGLAPFSFPCVNFLRTFELTATRIDSHVTTGGQSASLSWNKAPIWGLRSDFYYCQTVANLLIWDTLSDERTGLSFTISDVPRQRSHSRLRVSWDSRPYFTVSDSRLYFSSPPLTERSHVSSLYNFGKNGIEITTSNSSTIIACLFVAAERCLATRYPGNSCPFTIDSVSAGMCSPSRCPAMVI
jgi:hypothetical protein